jgi:phthiocerol/phenolphthiocerol synthesis type-I polyketide synthase D
MPSFKTEITDDVLRCFLIEQVAQRCRVPPSEIDPDRPLEEYGLLSRDAVGIAGELEKLLDRTLNATLVWEYSTISRLAQALSAAGKTQPAEERALGSQAIGKVSPDEPIAVIGIGCRFPAGIDGAAAFWELLLDGGDAIAEVPGGRWEPYDDGSPQVADALAGTTRYGGFLDDVAGFDAEFFSISPGEAEIMDPQQRILLEVAWEALEHAGLTPPTLRGSRTGTFIGICGSEYAFLTAADLTRVEAWTATGAALSIAANRLSYLLDLRGPSLSVDTACSSSLVAVHLAVRSLREGESELALAGGVNLLLSPVITRSFDQAGSTAPDGRCKAFDAAANGMVRGEGCGVVVLKRLADARREGDRVLAVIRATAVNQDGRSNGLIAPNPQAQEALLREAYGGIDPHQVDYVEAHGTGTLLGDPIEACALDAVLCRGRPEDRPLLLGSVKTNLGHLEAAAGVAGLIKTVLALAHRRIPPSLHFRDPNPHIPWDHLRVVTQTTECPRRNRPILAGVSSFGFGGTNAHVVLEEAPAAEPVTRDPRKPGFYVLADLSADRVREHAGRMADWLESNPDAVLGDVAYTLARRSGRGRIRSVVIARDCSELRSGLQALSRGETLPTVVLGAVRPMGRGPVWVFSGYGSQWPGMGRRLLVEEPEFAAAVGELDPLFRAAEAGFSLREVIEGGEQVRGVARVQPVLFGLQIALARLWRSYGVAPAAVIGHSMGEVAAAVVAGALSMADGVCVITCRSALLGTLAGGGAMAVLELPADEVPDDLHVAVYSAPNQTVVTGDPDKVAELVRQAKARGLLARLVTAEGAGHSPQVDPLLPALAEQLTDIVGQPPQVPFYSTALGDPRQVPAFNAAYWMANLRHPVQFSAAVAAAAEDGFSVFTEISPHPLLIHPLAENLAGEALVTHTLRRDSDDAFHIQLATLQVNGQPVAGPAGGRLINLPPAPWWHVRHWVEARPRAAARGDEHPLLGVHVELPGEDRHVWRADVGTTMLPWLAEHRVHGVAVLPIAAVAEVVLAAGGAALSVATEDLVVTGLELERFLPLTEMTTVTTTLTRTGAASARVEIHAQNGAGVWIQYGFGDVSQDTPTPVKPPVGIVSTVPEPARMTWSRHFRIHPIVLDRCLRTLAAEPASVPVAIGTLRVHGDPSHGGHCHADVTEVWLTDEDGRNLLSASGIVLRRVEPAEVPAPLTNKLFEVVWRENPLPERDAHHQPGSWVVIGDNAADLVAALEQEGRRVIRATVGYESAVRAALVTACPELRPPGVVLIVPGEAGSETAEHTVDPAAAERLVLSAAGVLQAILTECGGFPPRLWLVTRGAAVVRPGEAGSPGPAALRGLVRVLAFEHPGLRATLVDTNGQTTDLLTELRAGAQDDEVAWRDGRRYTAHLAVAALGPRRDEPVVRAGGGYVITGGYGGLGLVVARWLAERGAGRVVLNGRSGPSPQAGKVIAQLRETGTAVEVVTGDLAVLGVAERVVAAARADGVRLCGVVHAAGLLDDRLVLDLGADDLHRVWAPKVHGGWQLHQATGADLDWWVVFSSAAALLGSPGQASYATANAWLDALVAWRRAHGLPATTIGWGTWAKVGGATDNRLPGLRPINPEEGVEALEVLLRHDRAATGVVRLDPEAAAAAFPEISQMSFYAGLWGGRHGSSVDWRGLETLADPTEARRLIAEQLRTRVAAVLGFEPARLDRATPLIDVGLDSLATVRIRSAIEYDFAVAVPAWLLLQGASLRDLEEAVATELSIEGEPASKTPWRVGGRDAAERQIVRIFADVLGKTGAISVTDDLLTLGGDHEHAARVVERLAQETGHEVDLAAVLAHPTPEHVATLVRAFDKAEVGCGIVRPLTAPGRRTPFFCAHPAGGTTRVYQQLAELIGPDQPFFGLERLDDVADVPERANRYVELIHEWQPEGPYRLGGWSFGGVLAYEIACQLSAAGHEVELLALLDAGMPLPLSDEEQHENLARRFIKFAAYATETYKRPVELSLNELLPLDANAQLALLWERAGRAGLLDELSPDILRHQWTSMEDTQAMERYRPRPYGGHVVLYRTTEPTPWTLRDPRYDHTDKARGWDGLCTDLEIVPVPGHHLNLLDPPHVRVIADHLGALLTQPNEELIDV